MEEHFFCTRDAVSEASSRRAGQPGVSLLQSGPGEASTNFRSLNKLSGNVVRAIIGREDEDVRILKRRQMCVMYIRSEFNFTEKKPSENRRQ